MFRKYSGKSDSANEAVLGGVRSGILDYALGERGSAIVSMADWLGVFGKRIPKYLPPFFFVKSPLMLAIIYPVM